MSGHVSFVGAGPGARDLLTLRAVDRLKAADVVLHDDLATREALTLVRPGAEVVAVGKRAGLPSPKQAEVSRLIVDYARAGKRVARLKAGDPVVFGRVDEEVSAVVEAGIPFEIVPGITTASAAAARAGVSLTKRGVARRVQFVTGHDANGALPDDLDLAALADPHAVTCVFMGKATFPALVARLVAAGLSPGTPAILSVGLDTADESETRGTIATIAAALATRPPASPCMILYGAALAERQPGSSGSVPLG